MTLDCISCHKPRLLSELLKEPTNNLRIDHEKFIKLNKLRLVDEFDENTLKSHETTDLTTKIIKLTKNLRNAIFGIISKVILEFNRKKDILTGLNNFKFSLLLSQFKEDKRMNSGCDLMNRLTSLEDDEDKETHDDNF